MFSSTVENSKKPLNKHRTLFSKKQLIIIFASALVVVSSVSAALLLQPRSETPAFPLTAGIIDQLGEELPNPSFIANATTILENHGFNVTYYNGTIDVAFYSQLAQLNCGIIILRAHAALREDNSTVDLFTSEPYNPSAHVGVSGLAEGFLNYSSPVRTYFAVTSEFIENLQGRLPRSIVIAMGCNTLYSNLTQMAQAFHDKGAEAFIGWNGYVADVNTDAETLLMLENLVSNNQTIGDSIHGIYDVSYGSTLACYPQSAQDLKISNLAPNMSGVSATVQDVNLFVKMLREVTKEKMKVSGN